MRPEESLTRTEVKVVKLLADGRKNKEIAQEIGTTEFVIKNFNRAIFDKLGFNSRVQVALWWVGKGESLYTKMVRL